MKMRKLYRQFNTYDEGFLQVSPTHKIYYEQSGNPNGKPVLSLHGGPGSHSKPKYRKIFNPRKWRVIQFDQRGCGQSTPTGETKENTTPDLIKDIEKLRQHLGIEKWTINGPSWGSTLTLAYAETFPQSISGLILSSIFLGRKEDADWLFTGKELRILFPDLWRWRRKHLDKLGVDLNNPTPELYKILVNGSKKEQNLVTAIFDNWEGQIGDVNQASKLVNPSEVEDSQITKKKVFSHYAVNSFFLAPNQLLKNANKLPRVPMVIIHGRYDMVCPMKQAWELSKVIPHAKMVVVPGAGHSSKDSPKYINELLRYTDRFAKY